MDYETKSHYLKIALVVSGAAFLLVYPLSVVWPSGWVWHGGEGIYYFQMICAARKPAAYRSVISFTIWSSVVHAAIMAVQAIGDAHEHGHLVGDVPALLIVAGVLWYLSPRGAGAVESG